MDRTNGARHSVLCHLGNFGGAKLVEGRIRHHNYQRGIGGAKSPADFPLEHLLRSVSELKLPCGAAKRTSPGDDTAGLGVDNVAEGIHHGQRLHHYVSRQSETLETNSTFHSLSDPEELADGGSGSGTHGTFRRRAGSVFARPQSHSRRGSGSGRTEMQIENDGGGNDRYAVSAGQKTHTTRFQVLHDS